MPLQILILAVVLFAGYEVLRQAGLGGFTGTVSNAKIQAIAQAIAKAEGFGVAGAIPTRANNPGDLKLGDLGNGEIEGKTVFATVTDGWNALYHQISLMANGSSEYYSPTDTWREIAETWVGTDDYVNWMNNVVNALGVQPDTSMGDYLAS